MRPLLTIPHRRKDDLVRHTLIQALIRRSAAPPRSSRPIRIFFSSSPPCSHHSAMQHQRQRQQQQQPQQPRPSYADSTYYPPGWDRNRLLTASMAELNALPEAEFERMRQGMKTKMGEAAFQAFVGELVARIPGSSAGAALSEAVSSAEAVGAEGQSGESVESVGEREGRPEFLDTWEVAHGTGQGRGEWGFTVFRGKGLGGSEWEGQGSRLGSGWVAVKETVERLLLNQFGHGEGVEEAKRRFMLRWVDDERLTGMGSEEVAIEYGKTFANDDSLPPGLRHPFCLHLTQASLISLLPTSSASNFPSPSIDSQSHPRPPFIRVVQMITPDPAYEAECRSQAEEEGEPYPLHFNVAVESLLTEFYKVIGTQIMDLGEMGGSLKEDEVWVSAGRTWPGR